MYNIKKLSKFTKSINHLKEKVSELTSMEEGVIDFEKPWITKLPNLSEKEWQEIDEKGSLTKTVVKTETIIIEKA